MHAAHPVGGDRLPLARQVAVELLAILVPADGVDRVGGGVGAGEGGGAPQEGVLGHPHPHHLQGWGGGVEGGLVREQEEQQGGVGRLPHPSAGLTLELGWMQGSKELLLSSSIKP